MSFDEKPSGSIHLGITGYQFFCVMAASISILNFGWNLVVINQPEDIIIRCVDGPKHNILGLPSCLPTSDVVWGLAVGSYAIGNLIGAFACTWFSNKYGRRFVLIHSNTLALASALLLALSVDIPMFIIARVVSGIAQGAANGTFSTYVVEITTPKARNSLGCVLELAVNVGMTIVSLCSLGLMKPPLWRVLFSLTSALSLLSMAGLYWCVESPRWLAMKNRSEEAHRVLGRLRKGADITDEFEQLIVEVSPDSDKCSEDTDTVSVMDIILGRTPDNLRHQLLVSVMGMALQQASGICAIAFFSTSLFNAISPPLQTAGDTRKPTVAQYLSVGIAAVAVLFSVGGMFLAHHVGRRGLMFLSYGLMCLFSVLMCIGDVLEIHALAITSVFIFFGAYYLGAGPLTWVVPAEITPTYAIAAMMAITSSIGYLGDFTISLIFKPIYNAIHGYCFLVFAAANAISMVYIFFFLPETKDRTVSDLVRTHSVGIHNVLRAKYKVEKC
ncbi:Bifunctional purine biosynthesis protein PurH [Coemansia sp. RSA 1933]|nr:Bifunctional purine biosynthesis protein PurH [Coemansia sp. RSA 1933]